MKNFLKQFVGILMGILLIGSVFAVVSQRNNSKNEISQKRILFTDTGLPGGDPIIDVNTGGNTISYGPLLDGELNPYITGYSETDPVRNSVSGNYVGMSMTGDWNTAYGRGNHSGLYILETYLTGVISTLGLDTEVPTTKAVVDYVSGFANDIGPGLASGGYYITGYANYGRVWMSGGFLSFQILTGGNWEEQNYNPFGYITSSALTPYLTIANSGTYYTTNPLGYITGGQVTANETDPIWITVSGNYCPITIYTGLTNKYIPYRSGNRFFNSNIMFYTNTHIGTYSAGDTAKLNIRNSSTTFSKGLNITMLSGGLYNGIGIDVKASKPIVTTTQNIGDPFNTTNIENNSEDNGGYFMTNYVSDIGGFSSAISKGGTVSVANGASFSTSSPAGFYIMSGDSSLASTNGSWRIVMSGSNLSIQIRSGGAWIEKGHFTP